MSDAWLAMSDRWRLTRASLVLAVVLQACLIVFGIVRTDTVVRVNHLFPFADKGWHLLWYGGIAVLLWIGLRGRALRVLAVAAAFGALDEAVQAFTPGRSAGLADLSMDIAGAGIVVGVLVYMRAASRRSAREVTSRTRA